MRELRRDLVSTARALRRDLVSTAHQLRHDLCQYRASAVTYGSTAHRDVTYGSTAHELRRDLCKYRAHSTMRGLLPACTLSAQQSGSTRRYISVPGIE
eukprot:789269-Rhodomonas_salina.1